MRRLLIVLILLAAAGFSFFNLSDFAFQPLSNYSDLAISHYPNAVYLLHSIAEWRQIPLWSDAILSGYPFAADPLAGLWYLPGWIAYLFPLPLGFNLNVLLHLVWGAFGVFLFLKKEGKSDFAALAGAIIFELFSKNFGHFGAGHLTLLYAIAWTPWIFFSEKFYGEKKWSLLTGVFLGMVALADIRWFAFLCAAWIAYALYLRLTGGGFSILSFIKRGAVCLGLALLVAAPLLLPLLEFSGLSTRATMTAADSLAMSLPPSYLAGLAIPDLRGYAEYMLYPGGAALILAIFSLSIPELRRRNLFWVGMIVTALLIALGPATPVGSLLFQLPGFNLLRVPSRVLFLIGWAFAVMAADCIQFLISLELPAGTMKLKPPGNGLAIAGLSGFLVLICVGLFVYTQSVPVNYLWGTIAAGLAAVLVLLRRSQRISPRLFLFILIPFISLDLGGVDGSNLRFVAAEAVLKSGSEEAAWIEAQNAGVFRVYSPSYSLPQQTAAAHNLELADGVDPLQLKSYVAYMQRATGIPDAGYSVTLPPFATANPESDNQGNEPDADLLGRLNVRYVVSAFDLTNEKLALRSKIGPSRIYENSGYRERAWVQADLDPANTTIRPVTGLNWTPNQVELSATGPGWLVLSEIDYPGWKAWVDGQPAEIARYDSLLRAVQLPPGEHEVTFTFAPASVYAGIILGGIGWLIAFGSFFLRRKRW